MSQVARKILVVLGVLALAKRSPTVDLWICWVSNVHSNSLHLFHSTVQQFTFQLPCKNLLGQIHSQQIIPVVFMKRFEIPSLPCFVAYPYLVLSGIGHTSYPPPLLSTFWKTCRSVCVSNHNSNKVSTADLESFFSCSMLSWCHQSTTNVLYASMIHAPT